MKHGIFLSYSDIDRKKIKLIERELKDSKNFYPIIIAFNREANKPLAEKVAEGIKESKIVIPLLTNDSISTQWINQEIGYAYALDRRIIPIVENSIIDRLKGFIHKQKDLPYKYTSHNHKATENKDFVKQLRNLISDLEKEHNNSNSQDMSEGKTYFDKTLEQIELLNKEKLFQDHRIYFLNSKEGIDSANSEVKKMFDEIDAKITKFREKDFHCSSERSPQKPLTFIVRSDGFSFNIEWHLGINTVAEASLMVRFWNGNYTLDLPGKYPPDERPSQISVFKYKFEIDKDNKVYWYDKQTKRGFTSSEIVNTGFEWIIKQVSEKRRKQYSN